MSNPVPPTPAGAEAAPPEAPGFPPPPGDPAGFPPASEQPKKKGGALRLVGRILLGIVVVIGAIALKSVVFGDGAKDAQAGDCISAKKDVKEEGTTETGATVVKCDSSDAEFTVVARVDGETSLDSPACEKFFQPEEKFFVMASTGGKGYLLCLRPKA